MSMDPDASARISRHLAELVRDLYIRQPIICRDCGRQTIFGRRARNGDVLCPRCWDEQRKRRLEESES
jgi:hypothetical protein